MPSLELNRYLQLRGEGCSVATAADESGLAINEAWLTEEAVQRGELQFTTPSTTSERVPPMARPAKQEQDEVTEIVKPDFERAIKVMTNDIHPQNEKNATARGELSAGWKIIEDDCHVNKTAAKFYYKLTGMSEEKKDDVLRSLFGLMRTGNMGLSADLVDRMGDGEAPEMPISETRREGLATLQPELTH
jgi:hypothetical protein